LSFLSPGQFQVETWADATDSEDPNQLVYQTRTMAAADKLEVRLRGGGGQATRIRPATQ